MAIKMERETVSEAFFENDDFIVAIVNYGPMLAASIMRDLDETKEDAV